MNWPGLLKWSLTQHDGTTATTIPALTPEQKQWLKEALEATVVDEVVEMKNLITQINVLNSDPIIPPAERDPQITDRIEGLLHLLQNSDSAINFCKVGGLIQMYELAVSPGHSADVRTAACRMLAESTQNNHFVQDFSSKMEFWRLFPLINEGDANPTLGVAAIGALSAVLKGNNLVNKRLFISKGGLQFLLEVLEVVKNPKVEAKALSIISDLLYFKSHLAYNILTVEDQNQEGEVSEELRVFRDQLGVTEEALFDRLSTKVEPILSNVTHQAHFLRYSLVDCFKALLEVEKKEGRFHKVKWTFVLNALRAHGAEMEKLAVKDDFFEVEVSNLNDLFVKAEQ
jgi:hypothetical protein